MVFAGWERGTPAVRYLAATWMVGSTPGSVAFDEVAAQVIAVFLLALALEARFFRLHRMREPLELGATLFTMLVLAVGPPGGETQADRPK
jgi:hypothetical protein